MAGSKTIAAELCSSAPLPLGLLHLASPEEDLMYSALGGVAIEGRSGALEGTGLGPKLNVRTNVAI
jgi:hypothetical protein